MKEPVEYIIDKLSDDDVKNLTNEYQISKIFHILLEAGIPYNIISENINRLVEKKQQWYAKKKDGKRISVFDTEETWKNAINNQGYEPVDRDEAEAQLKKGKEEPEGDLDPEKPSDEPSDMDTEKPDDEPEEKAPEKPKIVKPKSNQFDKDDEDDIDTEDSDSISLKQKQQELREKDHQTTNEQLRLTKTQARAQAEEEGEKGVGAGTPESRAGEAAVHYALRRLVNDGVPIEDVRAELDSIKDTKGTVLNAKWVNAAINTAEWIHDVYGNDVDEIVWDTPEGRELIDAEGHGTSSDMFIKTKDGRNIGISLKQTTAVFLLNGGYATQHDLLVESLSEVLNPTELEEFKKATSINTYWHGTDDDTSSDGGFYGNLTSINEEYKTNKEFKDTITNRIPEYQNMSDEEFVKIFDSLSYRKHIDDTAKIIEKLPHVNQDQMKYIAKLVKDKDGIRRNFPDFYDSLRQQEITLTGKILRQSKSNPNVANGLKKICLSGLHVEDILFGKSEKLDEFITVYGNKPAVELDKGILLNVFGMKDEYEQYLSLEDSADKELFKEQLLEQMTEKLIIDYQDGARAGEVRIKHSGPPKQEFHLFGLKARAKGLGASPALEMNQTTFMGTVIKQGTADIKEWRPASAKKKYVDTRIKELQEEFEDSTPEQKQAIKDEIQTLRNL